MYKGLEVKRNCRFKELKGRSLAWLEYKKGGELWREMWLELWVELD